MLSIICLILFAVMLAITINYYVSTVYELARLLMGANIKVDFWQGGVLVAICFLLHHFI